MDLQLRHSGAAIKRFNYSHDAMIDEILRNPSVTQNELAAAFGYTPSWVSLVISSDAFQERLTQRKSELVDPSIQASIEERFKALTRRSLEVLQEKLQQPATAIPDQLALRAAELGAKALALGGNAPSAPPPSEIDHLDRLAKRLLDLQRSVRRDESIEAQFTEIPAPRSDGGGASILQGPRPLRDESAEGAVRADAGDACPAAL
jgi:DNA-binding MarR family transcriptional regulator